MRSYKAKSDQVESGKASLYHMSSETHRPNYLTAYNIKSGYSKPIEVSLGQIRSRQLKSRNAKQG